MIKKALARNFLFSNTTAQQLSASASSANTSTSMAVVSGILTIFKAAKYNTKNNNKGGMIAG